jgi:uncharacterized protein (UPF0335 family)
MPDSHLDNHPAAPVCSSEDVVGIAGALLKQHVEAIEHLEREKADIAEAIKERYASLKADGFDTKVVKAIIAERKKEPAEVSEFDMLLDTYKAALGMLPGEADQE